MGYSNSPCYKCTSRRAEPVSCRTTCEAWKKWEKKHKEEKDTEYQNRLKYMGDARQTLESCMRNKHYREGLKK